MTWDTERAMGTMKPILGLILCGFFVSASAFDQETVDKMAAAAAAAVWKVKQAAEVSALQEGNHLSIERRGWIPIQSCKSDIIQNHMECQNAHDGVINDSTGWAYGPPVLPTSVVFTLFKPAKVNRVGIKFMFRNSDGVAKKFQIFLKKGEKWVEPQVRVEGFTSAVTSGSVVELKFPSKSVDIAFARENDVTAVRITVHSAFSKKGNSVFSEVFVQNIPEGNCTTVGGLQPNYPCIFPFVNRYSNAVHYSCTTDQGFPPWCATRVNNNGKMTDYKYIGFCDQSCEVEELSTCYTTNSRNTEKAFEDSNIERRTCIFPFLLSTELAEKTGKPKDKWYTECVQRENSVPVCATTVNDHGVMIDYGACGPECPNSPIASQCIAASGSTGKGSRCVFPSCDSNEKKLILGCTAEGKCPTAVKKELKHIDNEWGFCHEKDSCDKNECITVGGARTGEACRFPFRNPWTKEMHYNCTTARLEEEEGDGDKYPSAPWCAVDTKENALMVDKSWGFCSKKCPVEKQNNCFIQHQPNDDYRLKDMKRCIFPFKYNDMTYTQCTYVKGTLKCPSEVDEKTGIAEEKHMEPCGASLSCYDSITIGGNPIREGAIAVGSYANKGSKDLEVVFTFETGIEDSSESNWAVEASVTAGFEAYGVSVEASITAGGGGGSAASSTSHQSHSLTYKIPPKTKVVLYQQVFSSGNFESRTFKLTLEQTSLSASRNEPTTRTLLTSFENMKSRDV